MYTCHLRWHYTAQSFHKLKVAFNNAFRVTHNLPTYCSASENVYSQQGSRRQSSYQKSGASFYDEIDYLKAFIIIKRCTRLYLY